MGVAMAMAAVVILFICTLLLSSQSWHAAYQAHSIQFQRYDDFRRG
jgi:hypothetical protein